MLSYFYYKIPYIAVQMAPAAALISVIILVSMMKKHNEITAIKASGISIKRLFAPLIATSVLLSVGVFALSEFVVPKTYSRSRAILKEDVQKEKQKQFYGHSDIWYKGINSIYWIKHFDAKNLVMGNPTFFFMDDQFRLILKIRARWAVWKGAYWEAVDGVAQTAREDGGFDSRPFDEMALNIPEKPEAFLKTVKEPEEMSYWELRRFAREIQREGYSTTQYQVDMNIKLAFPFITLIVVLIGIPIALRVTRGGAPLAVSLGIGACFFYLVVLGVARSFGLSGALPPAVSAWFANILFFLVGVYMMIHSET
jgi:lipopolysaccharide export system permease protein